MIDVLVCVNGWNSVVCCVLVILMFVLLMLIVIGEVGFVLLCRYILSVILLWFVNLIVLLMRFVVIWWICVGLLRWCVGSVLLMNMLNCRFLVVVSGLNIVLVCWIVFVRLNGIVLIVIWLVLIFDRLRMLLIRLSSIDDVFLIVCSCLCCVVVSGLWLISLRLLRIVFSGVWILWFIVVRNVDFVLFVVLVVCVVLLSWCLMFFCDVMLEKLYSMMLVL